MDHRDPRLDALIVWIRTTTIHAGGLKALVPVSGGSDSALCFWLCIQALTPAQVVPVYVEEHLRCRPWFEAQGKVKVLPEPGLQTDIEAQRWMMMLSQAKAVKGWLVGSRNRTEEVLGTYSLASRLATYFPLARLWKSEVMELARLVGVPEEILDSSRHADPVCGRPKEMADIPFQDVDRFLQVRVGERPEEDLVSLPPPHVAYLEDVYRQYRFKAALPVKPPA